MQSGLVGEDARWFVISDKLYDNKFKITLLTGVANASERGDAWRYDGYLDESYLGGNQLKRTLLSRTWYIPVEGYTNLIFKQTWITASNTTSNRNNLTFSLEKIKSWYNEMF